MKKKRKGFTLIELMVAMGIIAVLVTMSVVAIQIVQRSLRDTQRRDVLNTFNLWLTGYFNDNNMYPRRGDINFRADGIYYSGGGSSELIVELTGATQADSETSASGTDYCFSYPSGSNNAGSYRLGLKLESGAEVQLGNDTQDCDNWGTV